jgi:hypothetical protein
MSWFNDAVSSVSSFFTVEDQKQRLAAVGDTFNPFSDSGISITNPFKKEQNVSATGLKTAITLTEGAVATTAAAAVAPLVGVTSALGTTGFVLASPAIAGGVYAIASNPEKVASGGSSFVKNSYSATSDLGKVVKEPTEEVALQYLKDHPVASIGAAVALLIGIGVSAAGAASIAATYFNTKSVKDNTNAMTQGNSGGVSGVTSDFNDEMAKLAKEKKKAELDLAKSLQDAQLKLAQEKQKAELDLAKQQQDAQIKLASQIPVVNNVTSQPLPKKTVTKKKTRKKKASSAKKKRKVNKKAKKKKKL